MVSKIVIDADLVTSKVFLKLKGVAPKVFLLFLRRRKMTKVGKKGKEKWVISNNGEIVFPYAEAKEKFGITPPRFQRALDQLVEHGFIDITHSGGGMLRDISKYSISERWLSYGTDSFIPQYRQKDTRGLGFKKKEALKVGNENVAKTSNTSVP